MVNSMAKTLEDLMSDYKAGDSFDLTRGRVGTVKEVCKDGDGKVEKLIITDDKGKEQTVLMQTRHDVHRKK